MILLFFLLLLSCEYEPSGVFMREVNQDALPPEIYILELNLEEDTVYLFEDRPIHFRFSSSDQEILAVRFLWNLREEASVESSTGIFTLDYAQVQHGFNQLEIQILTKSGTGSIAEILGMEGYLFSKSWVVYADKLYSSSLSRSVENGFLRLDWADYPAPGFNEYIVYRSLNGSFLEYARVQEPFFIDSSYVGEGGSFRVLVSRTGKNPLLWIQTEISPELPVPVFSSNRENEFLLSWEVNNYFSAVQETRLYASIGYGTSNYSLVKSTETLTDTSHLVNALFGDWVNFRLQYLSGIPNSYNGQAHTQFGTFMGYRFDWPGESYWGLRYFGQVSPQEFMYLSNFDTLKKYSLEEARVTSSLSHSGYCLFKPFDRILYSASGSYLSYQYNCPYGVYISGSQNPESRFFVQLPSQHSYMNTFPAVNENLCILNLYYYNGFLVFNPSTSEVLAAYPEGEAVQVSLTGEYIVIDEQLRTRILRFSGGEFTVLWTGGGFEYRNWFFDGQEAESVYHHELGKLTRKNCSDLAVLQVLNFPGEKLLNIDFHNRRFLTRTSGYFDIKLRVRDLTDNRILYELPHNGYFVDDYLLLGNAIISPNGFLYFLNGM
jgi:hypothetical protein